MDDVGGFDGGATLPDRPRPDFVLAGGEETDVAERLIEHPGQHVDCRFLNAERREKLGAFLRVFDLRDFGFEFGVEPAGECGQRLGRSRALPGVDGGNQRFRREKLERPGAFGVGLPYPEKIETGVSNKGTLTFPGQSRLTFHLPASGGRSAFKLFWYDGKDNLPAKPADWDADLPFPPGKPEDWDDRVSHFPSNAGGALVIGSKASVILYDIWGMSCHIYPQAKFAELRSSLPPKTIPRYKGHHVQNWVDAITGKIPAPSAPFALAGHVNNLCVLGTVATRVNRTLQLDAAKKEFTGDAEATALLQHAGGYKAREGFAG